MTNPRSLPHARCVRDALALQHDIAATRSQRGAYFFAEVRSNGIRSQMHSLKVRRSTTARPRARNRLYVFADPHWRGQKPHRRASIRERGNLGRKSFAANGLPNRRL